MSAAGSIAAALGGAATWTLVEYGLHRFLGHDRRTRPNPFADEHTRHHGEGDYFAPTWKKALVALAVLAAATALAWAALGPTLGPIYSFALVKMYVGYELVHRRAHTHRGFGPWGRYMRRHHFHHHFENPRANHGVTTPLWDLVFGTFERPGRVRVPRTLAMRWLLEPATGEVRREYQARYELVGGAAEASPRSTRAPLGEAAAAQ